MTNASKGRYEVIEELHGTPLGRVYRALERETGERVLVRELVVPPNLKPDAAEEVAESFRSRARRLAALGGPHLARVLRVETEPKLSRQVFAGPEGRPAEPLVGAADAAERAARICRDVAEAVAFLWAHELPVGAICPADVFVARDGSVTVVDSGIVGPEAAMQVWAAGVVPWAMGFMAPEVLRTGEPTEPAAVYSIGALLHYLLTGRMAFEGATPAALVEASQAMGRPKVTESVPGLSEGLAAVLASALATDPSQRPQRVADLADRLSAIVGPCEAAPAPEPASPAVAPPGRRRRRSSALAWTAAAVGVVCVAIAVLVAWPRPKPEPSPKPPVALGVQPQPRQRPAPAPTSPTLRVTPAPTATRPAAPVQRMPTPSVTPRAPAARPPEPPRVYGSRVPANRWATVEVRCTVPDAKVYLDGVYAGMAPTTLRHVGPGEHTVTVEAKGHQKWSTQVTADPSQPALVIANPEPQ
jgi:hypothetical protein